MFNKISLVDFLKSTKLKKTSLLFIKEQGCKFCVIAEHEMNKVKIIENFPAINFYEISVDVNPSVATKLGLTGVPAFLKLNCFGKKV